MRPADHVLAGGAVTLYAGDCLDALRAMPDDSVDAVVTDPPYGLGEEPDVVGILTAWLSGAEYVGGSGRGFMGHAWDAGVPGPVYWREVLRVLKPGGNVAAFASARTQDLMAISMRIAGFEIRDLLAWLYATGTPKAKTSLKPALEPITLGRKPGAGGLNIEACRVPMSAADQERARKSLGGFNKSRSLGGSGIYSGGQSGFDRVAAYDPSRGRWPANVLHDDDAGLGEKGRYFFSAKASKRDRAGSSHPTVKPIALIEWLIRLVCPAGGLVLDPFAGSGTTGAAALAYQCRAILCEREPAYVLDIRSRLGDLPSPANDDTLKRAAA